MDFSGELLGCRPNVKNRCNECGVGDGYHDAECSEVIYHPCR